METLDHMAILLASTNVDKYHKFHHSSMSSIALSEYAMVCPGHVE
jgi:hypothetical protein